MEIQIQQIVADHSLISRIVWHDGKSGVELLNVSFLIWKTYRQSRLGLEPSYRRKLWTQYYCYNRVFRTHFTRSFSSDRTRNQLKGDDTSFPTVCAEKSDRAFSTMHSKKLLDYLQTLWKHFETFPSSSKNMLPLGFWWLYQWLP